MKTYALRTGNNNAEIQSLIINRLSAVEYTHTYVFAVRVNKMVKAVKVENAEDILPFVTYCEPQATSHGGVWGLRMWNSSVAAEIICDYGSYSWDICSVDEFERSMKEAKANGEFNGNRGDWFEEMFVRVVGGDRPEKRNAKCTECGDVILNGEHLQLKLWNATITTEPQVNKFYAEKMGI